MRPILSLILMFAVGPAFSLAQEKPAKPEKPGKAAKGPKAAQADKPAEPAKAAENALFSAATPVAEIKVLKDFKVELLHSVPKAEQGSWVSMCLDPAGRLIVCDQAGGLFRVDVGTTPPAISKIPVDIGHAQGLLWAFDSLYVVVNSRQKEAGLYRVRDTNGDGELDDVKQLRKLEGGGGEHGPHAVLLSPDGKSLTVVCGNQTKLTKFEKSRVPPVWGEDHLLPRMPDGNGFMRGVLGPGGAMYQVDPAGERWELLSVGFRNQYDAAYNRNGDLFTYDADMEWDFNTPWYRPTRVCLATSGSEFGWRNGAGKWPAYYPDSLPAVVDIGPGSPTGVTFGYGAKFPVKYQNALFINDWSYGKLYAVHLAPEGSAYTATFEEFVSGTPLPLTDMVVRPQDGALYFAIGGRGTQSGLYRVTYAGPESTAPVADKPDVQFADQRAIRQQLEAYHGEQNPAAVATAWPHLASSDRYLRFAARVAIEHQDPAEWRDKALAETNPEAALQALLALVRVSARDPFHHPSSPPADGQLKRDVLAALSRLEWSKLTDYQRLELLRIYAITFNRMGPPDDANRVALASRFSPLFPAKGRELNAELCQLLVYLQAPDVAAKTMQLLASAPTQEEQIDYARALRVLKTGWTPELRRDYFNWFVKAANYKGGNSLKGFFRNMKDDAGATLTDAEKAELKPILEAQPATQAVSVAPPRPFVKKWTIEELVPLVEKGLAKRDYDRGRTLFGQANCFACHRFAGEGGSNGPDLTGLAGRFSRRDLLESVVDPSKTISDQYAAVIIRTVDGQIVTGRIVNLHGDVLHVNVDMLNPSGQVNVKRGDVEAMQPSKVSMMPAGLLDTLGDDEVLDLVAFLLSRGDRNQPMFQ
ncbi:MAG: c-type cytochrome [Pirellulaceae bacterium]|nr:c-type cytochrome [Pirellulaceae bacterium]